MNAANPNVLRLQRIQKASRFLKRIIWIYVWLLTSGLIIGTMRLARPVGRNKFGIFGEYYASFSEVPLTILLLAAVAIVLTVLGLVAFYRLLSLYEQGVIFSPANAAQFRRLGVVAIGWGIVHICSGIFKNSGMLMFNPFEILASPGIYGGIFLLVVAWIMEEGSKIQEEQELTV
jgi:Protein of unknown function (DUF2975)